MNRSRAAVLVAVGATLAAAFFAAQTGCGDDSSTTAATDAGADGTDLDAGGGVDSNVASDGGADVVVADTGTDGGPKDAAKDGANDGGLPDGAVLDGGDPGDAAPGGNTTSLPCGAVASCPINGAVCCTYPAPTIDAGTTGFLCVGGATCPAGSDGGQTATVLRCTATANCATSNVCCAAPNQDNQGAQSITSTCKMSCVADAGAGVDAGPGVQLCDPTAADAGCPASYPCSSANITLWGLPPTYGTCGGVVP